MDKFFVFADKFVENQIHNVCIGVFDDKEDVDAIINKYSFYNYDNFTTVVDNENKLNVKVEEEIIRDPFVVMDDNNELNIIKNYDVFKLIYLSKQKGYFFPMKDELETKQNYLKRAKKFYYAHKDDIEKINANNFYKYDIYNDVAFLYYLNLMRLSGIVANNDIIENINNAINYIKFYDDKLSVKYNDDFSNIEISFNFAVFGDINYNINISTKEYELLDPSIINLKEVFDTLINEAIEMKKKELQEKFNIQK